MLLIVVLCYFLLESNALDLTPTVVGSSESDSSSSNPNIITLDLTPRIKGSGGSSSSSDCVCVQHYLCVNGSINTNGENVIDIKIKNKCGHYLQVCCKEPDIIERTKPATASVTKTKSRGCGKRNNNGIGYLIKNGEDSETQFAEFPWMVAILKTARVENRPSNITIYRCGGSLIHPQVVLTSAQCVSQNENYMIRAGEWDSQTEDELYSHQERAIRKKIIHPQYYKGAFHNDIALTILESPVEFADNVDTICLPNHGQIFGNSRCYVTGWGKDSFGKEGKYNVILKKADVPIVERDVCQQKLRLTRLGSRFRLHENALCAGGEGKEACKGDGGSPLVCPGSGGSYYQAGIVSWGVSCGEDGNPGVYTDVAKFTDWIKQQLKENEID